MAGKASACPLTTSMRVGVSTETLMGAVETLPMLASVPDAAMSRMVRARLLMSARSMRYVRKTTSATTLDWSRLRTICSNPARRFTGASTINALVARSARTTTSRAGLRSGRGARVLGSRGTGGSGNI